MVSQTPSADVRQLYGGTIIATIPSQYLDVSMIREVPDNQEVFSHAETDRSVIIELLELQHDIPSSMAPAEFHLNNIAEESGALETKTHKLLTLPATDFPCLLSDDPELNVTAAYGTHVVSKFKDAAELASHVDVYVACMRLPRANTDLLIVFNDPRVLHPQGSSARTGSSVEPQQGNDSRDEVLKSAMSSLKIRDWGLLL